jgi:hypothetical protein
MIDHAYSLQDMSTLASPYVSCPSVRLPTKELSERMLDLSQSLFPHFSVIRSGRRKLAPAALARVPLEPAPPTL